MRYRSIERKNKEVEAEIIERPQKIQTQLAACVDIKGENAIKTTFEKVDNSSAGVMTVQPKNAEKTHTRARTKKMSDMDLNIRKKVRNQGVPKDSEKSEHEKQIPQNRRGERNTWKKGPYVPYNRATATLDVRL